ncbi:restriction endonuclease subunit S [Ectopseudomonas mendocina]|uniref:restriction endonuclease subunit S n=1 Tax=Ectopseudomonas mendocina TaxID=300 RepID=UPI001ADF6AED|nr:restriction endonuclease subunit S [Pseudomonas mendocina]QTN47549.1 restriction endonuclease subunit S [Pseudomonas mendocina]
MNKLPAGWKLSRLEELATVERGKFSARPRNDPKFFGGDIPFVQTGEISAAGTYLVNHKQTLNELGKTVSKVFPKDSILITIAANIGETAITTYEVACPDSVVAIIPRPAKAHVFWLKKVLETLKDDLDSKATQNAQKNINLEVLRPLEIATPPIEEQTKIAKILSTWDKAIATTERLLANSQQQKHALMQQLLIGQKRFYDFSETWHQVTLDEVFEKICNGVTYDANATTGLPVSRIETISTGKINFSKVGWAPDNENTKRFQLKKGDILYSHINSLEHIGRVALFNSEKPLFHGMNLLLLRPNKKIIPEFIFYVLSSKIGKKYARNYAKSAVNQASISTTDIKSFAVSIPPLPEQQKIAQVLSTADAEIANLQAQLDKLKLEKKALMQQLLTGKRRVRLDDEEEDVEPIRRVG